MFYFSCDLRWRFLGIVQINCRYAKNEYTMNVEGCGRLNSGLLLPRVVLIYQMLFRLLHLGQLFLQC